jgi:hypothetical protein
MNNRKAKSGVNQKKRIVNIKSGIPALVAAYPGQVVKQMKFEGAPLLLTTTVTTGVIAQVQNISSALIANFAARLGGLFEEYRIVRVKFLLKCFSSTNPGLMTHWLDEKQVGVPTSGEAIVKSTKQFSASSPSPHSLMWTANDPLDLQYLDIGTVTNVASYKIYTDTANFGSSAVVTPYGQLTSQVTVQFRGYN